MLKILLYSKLTNELDSTLLYYKLRDITKNNFIVCTIDELDTVLLQCNILEILIDPSASIRLKHTIYADLRKKYELRHDITLIIKGQDKVKNLFFYNSDNSKSSITLENNIALLNKQYNNQNFICITNCFPLYINSNWTYLITSNVKIVFEYISIENISDIVINDQKNRLIMDILKYILSSNLLNIYTIKDNKLTHMQCHNTHKSKGLFIFPDRMLPVKRAFQLRGLDLISHLNKVGLYTDILILGPNNRDLEKINNILSTFVPKVYTFPMVRGVTKGIHKVMRLIETKIRRKIFNINTPPPMTFKQRIDTFVTKEHIKYIETILEENNYEYIIVTGSWFYPAIEQLTNKNIKLICDTHDIFFISDEGSNQTEKRFFYYPKLEKKLELEFLSKFDKVIAISDSDLDNLYKHGQNHCFTVSGSFEYALLDIREPKGKDLKFGFIGTGNKNNQKALQKIINDWLNIILEDNDKHQIILAGSICQTDLAKELVISKPNNILLLGFVDNLSDYYNKIDISLSPIMLQGGLNFKTVEALMAGKPVITTDIGSRCVYGNKGVYCCETDCSLKNVLQELKEIKNWYNYSKSIQNNALDRFDEKNGFQALDEYISTFYKT